jgi:hypothetical protein
MTYFYNTLNPSKSEPAENSSERCDGSCVAWSDFLKKIRIAMMNFGMKCCFYLQIAMPFTVPHSH